MARRKRNSTILERAQRRLESACSINPALNLGGGLTVTAFAETISDLQSKLAAYNTALSSIDKLADDVKNAEQIVNEMSEKMLMGIGSQFGRASQEYEMAGGSRRKSARRSTDTSTPATTSAISSAKASTNGASTVGV
jgi:hypothetical protein